MAGQMTVRGWRWASGAFLGLVMAAAVGCNDSGYPTALSYPGRTDLLVIKAPSDLPVYNDAPGELDRLIARIKDMPGGQTLDPGKLAKKDRDELDKELPRIFGTPAAPLVQVADDDDAQAAIDELKLDPKTLARGSSLYRRHCLHCHGLSGDGRGASGAWLNPHPRDYRQGKFKFMSSEGGGARKPRRADIYRTLYSGIESTSMPAFNLLPEADLDAMVSYVIHLSIRGETEFNTISTLLNNGDLDDGSIGGHVATWAKRYLVDRWAASNRKLLKPSQTPSYDAASLKKSILNGYKLFSAEGDAGCISCHIDFGRQVPFRFDDWGTLVRPMNLTVGTYRGGRRPIDLYWRIKGGIDPSGMPAPPGLTDDKVWDLVNFLQALPYPKMLPEEIRERIYVPAKQVAAH